MAGAHFDEVLATLQPVDTWMPTAAKEQVNRKSLRPESFRFVGCQPVTTDRDESAQS